MPNIFCKSHRCGEQDPERLDCYEISIGRERVQCPYNEEHIQLRIINGNPQLYIPEPNIEGLHACHDFIPTPETNSRLIAKLSQQ